MSLPTIALAEHLTDVLPSEWSVLQGPLAQVEPLALVIRADSPWIEPSSFCHDLQHYSAIAAVPAASPADGEQTLYAIIHELMDNLPEGWRFVSSNGTALDNSTGLPLLTARIILEYANNPAQEAS